MVDPIPEIPEVGQNDSVKESPPEQKEKEKSIDEDEPILQETEIAANPRQDSQEKTSSTPSLIQPAPENSTAQNNVAVQVTSQATPLYYRNPKPPYPALARKRNLQGSVILSITVLAN